MKAFLGIDLGTSSVKALLLSSEGEILAQSQENYNFETPQIAWAEHQPDAWWEATVRVVKEVTRTATIASEDILALSFSGQMHGLVTIDSEGRSIRPAIIWADQRSALEVAELNERFTLSDWKGLTLNPSAAGFLLPSLLWLRKHEPENYQKISSVLLPKDYLRMKMTGKVASDFSDAAGSGAFDVQRATWSRVLLQRLELREETFPEVFSASHDCGPVLEEVALELGLTTHCRVYCGAADQAMQALGNGIVAPGTGSVTVGTGGQVFVPLAQPLVLPKLNAHVFNFLNRDSWFFLAANLSAGLALRWLRDNILENISYRDMDQLAEAVPVGSEGVLFLPYLLGERTPHMDPAATAQFSGLRFAHNRSHMIRALLEGVAFALKESFELLPTAMRPEKMYISGGGAQSPLWRQIIADVLDQTLVLSSGAEQAALGAAVLAAYGSGYYENLDVAVEKLVPPPVLETRPIKANSEQYQVYFEHFKAQYRK